MGQTKASEAYDLLILVDSTGSMGSFLNSLRHSLPQIISISALTDCFERIGVLAYRDYDQPAESLLEWSGWLSNDGSSKSKLDIISKTNQLTAKGGSDAPEAAKTGLARAYQLMRSDATTLILLYADAPPHLKASTSTRSANAMAEEIALVQTQTCGPSGALFADWIKAARVLSTSTKRAHVINILDSCCEGDADGYFWYLSESTGGVTINLDYTEPRLISEVTIEILLSWMGVRKEGIESESICAKLVRYELSKSPSNISEDLLGFHAIHDESVLTSEKLWDEAQYELVELSRITLDKYLPRKRTILQNFAEKYKSSQHYRNVVTEQLREIVDYDVTAISLNPVFGSLWRVFCNDRENDHRLELLSLFGRKVEEIQEESERVNMRNWLAESYDFTAEVLQTISKVPGSRRFPCVYLDPTLDFTQSSGMDGNDDEENLSIASLRRNELLEIGRSCDQRILRRLGRVLTQITYIESADDMPAHIAATADEEVPKIPMALASTEHNRQFWRLLLHVVVPGTILSARPAALLAALAINLGITPLITAAEQELLFWRARWNNLEVPETWNSSCLSLLLKADGLYQQKIAKDGADRLENGESLLQDGDRAIFKRLVEYKLLENNLDTTLTARVGWCPAGATMPIGPIVSCNVCRFPRSVTVMGPDNTCGLCLTPLQSANAQAQASRTRVLESDNAETNAAWYECSVPKCRGQYVVYGVERLRARPKCHYCRVEGVTADSGGESSAPRIECVRCLSRMIWPHEYRLDENLAKWECIGCRAGKNTITDVEVTANELQAENGRDWLLGNFNQKLIAPFNNRSLFHIASSAAPLDDLCDRLTVLPGLSNPTLQLLHHSKPIHNTPDLLSQLSTWIQRGRVQAGTCSLCFRDRPHASLRPACGRSGCGQRICPTCLRNWYGLNAPGRVINTSALSCPFCRRAPTAKTLAAYGMGVQAVGDLREAVARRGEWIYAWCRDCGHARPYLERVCAAGAANGGPDVRDWTCEPCLDTRHARVSRGFKDCPACGIATEKVGGCDHITCRCGAHWCFFCGEPHTAGTIYRHMSERHGGFYAGF